MTRVRRDYCNKGRHPNWKAWSAKYDMSQMNWPWLGNFCEFCGSRIETAVAWPK